VRADPPRTSSRGSTPASCAQHQIADVGIEGVLEKVDREFIEAMDIRVGGRLGPEPKFGDVVVKKVPHYDLDETLLRIFTLYEHHHAGGETFRDLAARTGPDWWTERLEAVDALAEAGGVGHPVESRHANFRPPVDGTRAAARPDCQACDRRTHGAAA